MNPFVGQAFEHETFFTRLHHFVLVSDAYIVDRANGTDLRRNPIEKKCKAVLAKRISRAAPRVQFNEHIEEDGTIVFEHACKLGLEGIVSKRKGSPYSSGRSPHWTTPRPFSECYSTLRYPGANT
jgi:histone H3/H4